MDDRAADHGPSRAGPATVPETPPPGDSTSRPRWHARLLAIPARVLRHASSHPGRTLVLVGVVLFLGVGTWILSWRAYAWHQLEAGKRELARDHFGPALEHFQAALTIWPEDAATLFLAARAARRAGDYESADFYLTRCQSSPSQAEQAELERALLRACKGEVDAVTEYCEALLQQGHVETPLILEALIQGELVRLRFAEASRHLDRWLADAPDHPQALYLRGRLQLHLFNSQEALSLYRRAVKLDAERDDVRLQLAALHLDLGQAQEGVPHLEEVCRKQPHNMLAKARLGQGLVLLGRQEEAIRVLDEVLRARPDLTLALLERGKLAFRDGEMDKAQDLLQKACKRDPVNRAAHYQLLQCLKQQGNDKEARLVQTRMDQIDLDAARTREIVNVKLPLRRHDPDLHAELGELFLRAGAMTEGLRWLHSALQVNPRHSAAHRSLAKHYQSLGQFGQAQQHRALGGLTESESK